MEKLTKVEKEKIEKDNQKKLLDRLAASGHGKPVTRREALGLGLISGGAYVIAPSVLGSLYAQTSMAQDALGVACPAEGGGAGGIGAIVLELAGGSNLAGYNVFVGGLGGQRDVLPDYRTIGGTAVTPTATPQYGLYWNQNSQILAGMNARITDQAVKDKVKGILFCATSGDDTANNMYIPTHHLVKAGAAGEVAKLIGTAGKITGARSQVDPKAIEAGLSAIAISKPADAVSLVAKNAIAAQIGDEALTKILKTTANMGTEALCNVSRRSLSEQMALICGCRYDKSYELATKFTADVMDPTKDPMITTAFGPGAANATDVATIAKVVVTGLAGVGVVVKGGYDYHGQGKATQDTKDRAVGDAIGGIIAYAALKNRPVTIIVVTDGGVSSDASGAFQGDSGQRSSALQFSFHPNGTQVRAGKDPQVGAYKADGTIDRTVNAISDSSPNLALAFTANFLALKGEESKLAKIFGDSPISSKLEEYVVFAKS
jgi:hypothetical protein